MKGVILAGGEGTRLGKLTVSSSKQMQAVYGFPLIYFPLYTLRKAGILDILIITTRKHLGHFGDQLGSGEDLGVDILFKIQEQPLGLAHGLGLAKQFVGNDSIVLILGDNYFEEDLTPAVERFKKQKKGASVVLKKVPDPHRFGVAETKGDKVVKIVEKPEHPKSNLAVTGFYMYDNRVFRIIPKLKPSWRKEIEITDLNNEYVKEDTMSFHETKKIWIDAGTPDSLLRLSNLVHDKMKEGGLTDIA